MPACGNNLADTAQNVLLPIRENLLNLGDQAGIRLGFEHQFGQDLQRSAGRRLKRISHGTGAPKLHLAQTPQQAS